MLPPSPAPDPIQTQLPTPPAKPADLPTESPRKHTPSPRNLPHVDLHQRDLNRALPTDQVLALVRQHLPEQFPLAEVVGKWIWIEFPEAPAQPVRAQLSQLGFHWNTVRKCWQHPCGLHNQRTQDQPREKYKSYFPVDQESNPHLYNGPARTAEQVAA